MLDLGQLQNACKRDPEGYKQEFIQKLENFNTYHELFNLKPHEENKNYLELLYFMSHVSNLIY